MGSRIGEWLADRSSVDARTVEKFNRPQPAGVAWWNTLGPTILVLFLVQAVTGTFLAMYYSPHPDGAYQSMRYVDLVVPMGRLLHGIHRYTDSAIIILLGLHL